MTEAEKRELGANKVTLDGEDANVVGYKLDFAFVVSKSKKVEYAWSTVERIIKEYKGEFKS